MLVRTLLGSIFDVLELSFDNSKNCLNYFDDFLLFLNFDILVCSLMLLRIVETRSFPHCPGSGGAEVLRDAPLQRCVPKAAAPSGPSPA